MDALQFFVRAIKLSLQVSDLALQCFQVTGVWRTTASHNAYREGAYANKLWQFPCSEASVRPARVQPETTTLP